MTIADFPMFASIGALLAVMRKGPQSGREGAGWNGKHSWEDAMRIAKEGWMEGTVVVKEYSAMLWNHIADRICIEEPRFDVTGDVFDAARWATGDPACWKSYVTDDGAGFATQFLTVVLNCAVSAGVSPETILHRGAAVAALIQLFEAAGHRARLMVGSACAVKYGSKTPAFSACVTVKDYDQDLDIDRLAFACAHPAMLRRLVFSLMEQAPSYAGWKGSLGYPCPMSSDQIPAGAVVIDYALSGGDIDWNSPKVVEQWLVSALTKHGVHLS